MTEEFPAPLHSSNPGVIDPSLGDPARIDQDQEKQHRLEAAEQWLVSQTAETVTYPDVVTAATASGEPVPSTFNQTEPVPTAIAAEVALLAQQRLGLWEKHDLFPDESGEGLHQIRNEAIDAATELDFGIVEATLLSDWPLRVKLNAMHDKFKDVSPQAIRDYIGEDDRSEYKAMHVRNIIADHAPELLTPDVQVLLDPSQPQWRVRSAHAGLLFKNRRREKLDTYVLDRLPTEAPTGSGTEYTAHDEATMKSVHEMDDVELSSYALPDAIASIREHGAISFKELTPATQEALLTRRFYEMSAKSNDPKLKQAASERNQALEHGPVLQEGDFVHATYTPEVLDQVLSHGLQCGEAVLDNTRSQINYPFTVSFLKVTPEISQLPSMPERLNALINEGYGSINIVLQRDSGSTDFDTAQQIGQGYQRQIFGGVPSTEIKSIVIRDETASEDTAEGVINSIVKHGVFIPVYKGSTGELLLSSDDFEARRSAPSRIGELVLSKS